MALARIASIEQLRYQRRGNGETCWIGPGSGSGTLREKLKLLCASRAGGALERGPG